LEPKRSRFESEICRLELQRSLFELELRGLELQRSPFESDRSALEVELRRSKTVLLRLEGDRLSGSNLKCRLKRLRR
jgi:hypothetical protein